MESFVQNMTNQAFGNMLRLNEMAATTISDLDAEFLQRATRVTSFNLTPKDFTTLKYKSEIQHLFRTHFFPDFDLDKTIKGNPSQDKLNSLILSLKKENLAKFKNLHTYNLKGVGPGEATLFFLLDDASLGGGAAAGADINISGKAYEVKSGDISKGLFKNFKIGGTVPLDRIVSAGLKIRDMNPDIKSLATERAGVSGSQIKAILSDRKLAPLWKRQVEQPYIKAAHAYLSKNPLICMINKTPAARIGEVVFIGKPSLNQVGLDVITQGTIKPTIKI